MRFVKSIVKCLLIYIFLIGFFLAQLPTASAWFLTTHKEIVECNYNAFPPDIQKNMDIKKMKEGSIAPDIQYRNFGDHQYPESYPKIQKWLKKGHDAYSLGNYKYASYCYGVASHYISDTLVAPHAARIFIFSMNTTISSQWDHIFYEGYASYYLKPYLQDIPYSTDLNSTLYNGHLHGQIIWKYWSNTSDYSIIPKNLDQAATTSYNIIIHSLKT